MSIADLRKEYTLHGLTEADIDPDPFSQFRVWFDEAAAARMVEPNAMTLATAGADGRPSARTVLLKEFDASGFVFYTSYDSPKGRELAENPWAALVFYWAELERQVRIEGRVERVPAHQSDAYFQSRPRGSRLSTLASRQSAVIDGREALERRVRELEAEYDGREIPRSSEWGGYRLVPTAIEFWQGRLNRLHDRLRYRRLDDGTWQIERLSP